MGWPLAGSCEIPALIEAALDQQRSEIGQALVLPSFLWPVRPLRLDNARRQLCSPLPVQWTVPECLAVVDRVGGLKLGQHQFTLIVAEDNADIRMDLLPDGGYACNRCLTGGMASRASLERRLLSQVLTSPHLHEFIEWIGDPVEPVLSSTVHRHTEHPLLGSSAELRAVRCPDAEDDFSHASDLTTRSGDLPNYLAWGSNRDGRKALENGRSDNSNPKLQNLKLEWSNPAGSTFNLRSCNFGFK